MGTSRPHWIDFIGNAHVLVEEKKGLRSECLWVLSAMMSVTKGEKCGSLTAPWGNSSMWAWPDEKWHVTVFFRLRWGRVTGRESWIRKLDHRLSGRVNDSVLCRKDFSHRPKRSMWIWTYSSESRVIKLWTASGNHWFWKWGTSLNAQWENRVISRREQRENAEV